MRNIFAFFVAAILGGCAMSQSFLPENEVGEVGCQSTAGSYSLSKTTIGVEVGQDSNKNYFLNKVELHRRADASKTYCLDYLASRTADEGFAVARNDQGLLQKVVANSHDQSAYIAKKIAETIFTFVSQNPNFDVTARGLEFKDQEPLLATTYHAEFDPFNPAQADVVNAGLSKFGFCLVQESAQKYGNIDNYCDNPLGGAPVEHALEAAFHAERQAPPLRYVRGILYRPRVPYTVYLFVKRNLKARGGWRLKASEAIHIENNSPILGIDIERAVFAKRKTILTFDDGALNDVDIDKTSELAGFVEIPLYIVQGIAALPANIIQVKIDNTNNNIALINAQDQLIATQKQYNATLSQITGATARGGAPIRNPNGDTQQLPASNLPENGAQVAVLPPPPEGTPAVNACVRDNSPTLGATRAASYCECTARCLADRNQQAAGCANFCGAGQRN
jgi:hypothetical protein